MGNFQKNKLRIRILAAIPAAAILIVCIILHGWYIFAAAVLLAVELEFEMIHSLKRAGYHTCRSLLVGITLAMPLVYRFVGEFYVLALLVFGAATLFAVMIIRHDKYTAMDSMVNIFALIYPMAFVFFLFPIILEEDVALSQLMLVCAFAAAFGTDFFRHFVWEKKTVPQHQPQQDGGGSSGRTHWLHRHYCAGGTTHGQTLYELATLSVFGDCPGGALSVWRSFCLHAQTPVPNQGLWQHHARPWGTAGSSGQRAVHAAGGVCVLLFVLSADIEILCKKLPF